MSRLLDTWNTLLTEVATGDVDDQEYACFRVALVLDRHNKPHQLDPALYEDNLSRELLRLTLDHRRQGDAVDYLLALAKNHPGRAASALFALTKAHASVMLPRLLKFLGSDLSVQRWPQNAKLEIVMGLRAAIRQDAAHIATIQANQGVMQLLGQWSEASDDVLAARTANLYDRVITEDADE
jgi:hypothetical protein